MHNSFVYPGMHPHNHPVRRYFILLLSVTSTRNYWTVSKKLAELEMKSQLVVAMCMKQLSKVVIHQSKR